jgi:hypothetical protein
MTRRDPVSPAVARAVLLRDRMCFLARLDDTHICRDAFGWPHAATDLSKLTIEHVKRHLRMGVRGPSRPEFMVALCAAANIAVPSKADRVGMRSYLAALYPAEWA